MLIGMQPLLLFLTLLFTYAHTIKPPVYVEPQKADADPNPPKYEYGYNIVGDKGGEQGKQEQRDGIYASGRYFVQNKDARQDVQYFADDWGYHPAVEYANVGPHSKSSTKFALGHEAVVQLRNKENNLPQLEGLPDTGPLKKEGRNVQLTQTKSLTAEPENPQPNYQQPTLTLNPQSNYDPFKQQQHQQQTILQQSEQIIQEQPQQIYQEQQQQQIIHQQPQQTYPEQQQQIIHEQPRQIIQEQQQIIHEQPRQIIQEQQQQQIIHDQPQQIIQEQQQIIHDQPQQIIQEQQQIIHDQPQQIIQEQQQQQIIHEQPQQIVQEQQQIIQKQPQQQIVLEQQNTVYEQQQKEQPHEQQLIYEQQPFAYEQQPYSQSQQLVVQHVQQPIEHLIFPQSTPSPIDDGKSVLFQQQEQQNIVLLGQKNVNQEAEEQANAFSSQQFGLRYQIKKPNKLIASTQHLVTGQDVLDINHAAAGVSTTASYEDFGIKSTPCSTLTEVTGSESNFKEQPIVAAEVENNIVSTTGSIYREQEQFISTTASTIGDLSTTFESSTPTPTIVVTPRTVSPTYVTPVSAGFESTEHYDEKYQLNKQNVQIEVQKTIPYYLGKYDYPSGYGNTNHSLVEQRVKNDLELGNTLFYFPGQLVPPSPVTEVNNHVNIQQLPSQTIENQFVDLDQQVAQGYQHQVVLQQQQKVIHQPYPVRVPVHVVKQVSVPVTVEKVVEKPVHITKIVEKPVAVPQPYPVERVVEKPVHVPVQITKYIDRPYPVEVRVPYPQPYPVEKIVEKIVKQPYPVEVRVPVHIDRIVEKKVPVPHYIEKQVPVEKIVERKVPQYVDRPYPVHIQVPVPTPVAVPVDRIIERKIPVPQYIEKQVPVEKIVEKPVPQYIDRPYPVPQPYYVRVEVPRRYLGTFPVKFVQRPYSIWPVQNNNQWHYDLNSNLNAQAQRIQQNLNSQVQARYNENHSFSNTNIKAAEQSASDGYHYPNPYSYAPQNSFYLPPKQELVVNKEYLPPLTHNCDHGSANGNDNYVGLSPPKVEQKNSRKYRSPRSNFNDKSIKMEYGFQPPLVPSLEIDEYGQPVEKGEK